MATVPLKHLVNLQIKVKFLLLLSAFNLAFGDYCIYHRFSVWLETSKRAVINFILFYTCTKCANFYWGLTGKEFQNNTTFCLKKTKQQNPPLKKHSLTWMKVTRITTEGVGKTKHPSETTLSSRSCHSAKSSVQLMAGSYNLNLQGTS